VIVNEPEVAEHSADYGTVDLNSLDNNSSRSAGVEYVVYETVKTLEIDKKLVEFGLKPYTKAIALIKQQKLHENTKKIKS